MNNYEKPRLARLTQMVTQLQSKKRITATQLASKYNISKRTVYRDIKTLQNSGIPIVTEQGKGYSLMEGFNLPPVMFTEKEANALITAAQMIQQNKDESLVEEYNNAITKIQSVLKNTQKGKNDFLARRIYYRQNVEEHRTSNLLMDIQAAITNFSLLKIEYQSLQKKFSERTIEPFALYSTQGNWLLIAYCRLRNDFRAFRIDLIQKLTTIHQQFEPHKITLAEYFEQCQQKV